MNEIPWYFRSPSPWSVAIWIILAAYAYRCLKPNTHYKKAARFLVAVDSILILSFFQVLMDAMWCVVCGLRFGAAFPADVPQISYAFLRDILAAALFYLLIGAYFKRGILKFDRTVQLLILANAVFLAGWFLAADSPALTDWNFAIKHGYDFLTVARAFTISHVVGRILFAVIFISLFKIEDNSIRLLKAEQQKIGLEDLMRGC